MRRTQEISVCMSFYNAENFIEEAIESILNQTFSDFELIIVNDGSTDKSSSLVKSFKDDRIRLIHSTHDFIHSLNLSLANASGKYIARMDADDIMLPNRLETQYLFLESHPEIDICGTWAELFGDADATMRTKWKHEDIISLMLLHNPIINPSTMMRRDKCHIGSTNKYSNDYPYAEDYKMWVDLATQGFRFANIPEVLVKYRRWAGQVTEKCVDKMYLSNLNIRYEYAGFVLEKLYENSNYQTYIDALIELNNKEMITYDNFTRIVYYLYTDYMTIFNTKKEDIIEPGYEFNKLKYKNTFLNSPPSSITTITKAKEIAYCFWTGDNAMSPDRRRCFENTKQTIGIHFQLVTPDNLNSYILKDYPLHPAYPYLSLVHKADYLRCYFMHHYGGGYSDIKEHNNSWIPLFKQLNDSNAWILGYREIGESGAVNLPSLLGYDIKRWWKILIGNGCYICKPNTPFTFEWYIELHRRLDNYQDNLEKCPGNILGDNSGYPIPWSNILGNIFHPLCLKYNDKIIFSDKIKPSFVNYR